MLLYAEQHMFGFRFVLQTSYFIEFISLQQKDKKTMKPKIWLYRNKETGESKGEATITYDDSNAAKSAISWFHNKDFNGVVIHVSLAQRQNNWQKGGGGGGGGFRGRGGPQGGGPPGGRKQIFQFFFLDKILLMLIGFNILIIFDKR